MTTCGDEWAPHRPTCRLPADHDGEHTDGIGGYWWDLPTTEPTT